MIDAMSELSGPRQRAADTKKRRSEAALLAAIEKLFGSKGWDEIRMEDIAAEARLSPATAYTYFKNKRSMMGPAYRQYFVDLQEALEKDLENGSALQAIEQLVLNIANLITEKSGLTAALLTATREQTVMAQRLDPEEKRIAEHVPMSDLLRAALERARANGEIAEDLPASLANIASYHTNALLLRVFMSNNETSRERAHLVLSQLRPAILREVEVLG